MRLQCSTSVGLVVTKLTLQTAWWSMFLLEVTLVVLPELKGNLTDNTVVALTVTEVFRPANKNTEYEANKVDLGIFYKNKVCKNGCDILKDI